ncbi:MULTISPECIES: hypothetical protein [Limosilactobacillus]|uniref:hypothetical protein n=1 Tax=Limosilactobacillus TaxID=2742598 RepID=UPI00098F23B8|nr:MULTISPECIES: hypothetical protein [Limosilactobacillus]MDM8243284.1 hypothetical protein [Limosilactobacillus vaginalis]NMV54343.1 hypothetical protein [Limosilactobacillus reuteri]NMV57377.1 hypothetical protein [Limosilactobacillus reuteri]OTA42975.1 hypothetical protein BHL89_02805 [Limosilactobacillus reuteri]WLW44138.1 hypothetical protein RA155_09025 [Limosilactobacillus fermentum]
MSIVSDSISVAEKVQEIAKKYKDKELNNEIIALQQKIISLGNDNLKLKEELTTLKSEVCSNKTVKMDDNGFIRKEKDNKKYCPKCWNKDRKLSIMPNHGIKEFDGINEYAFECPACGYIVYSKDNFTNTTKNDTQPK